jgi:hypothetical protein
MILAALHAVGPSNNALHLATLKRRASRYGSRDERVVQPG